MERRKLLPLLASTAAATCMPSQAENKSTPAERHCAWVGRVLHRMLTIKPGMKKSDLLDFFYEQGGMSAPFERTFVSKDCQYFKVDVKFHESARSYKDDGGDVILHISEPYLELFVYTD